jgi:metal-dependent amidase/aminoacylase/carboxypeptidase family protein
MRTMNLRAEAANLHADLVSWRRHLHMHPELSYKEFETAAFVRARLVELGLTPSAPLAGGTGLTCLIEGLADGPTVGLRADMDALPDSGGQRGPVRLTGRGGRAHVRA